MPAVAVHQVVDTMAPASATSNCVLAVQIILRNAGYTSDIRARVWERGVVNRMTADSLSSAPHRTFRRAERTCWLYHFSVGSRFSAWLEKRAARDEILLWYHNLTPPQYFAACDPLLAARLAAGREEVRRLATLCRGAIACSEFSAAELRNLGYREVQIAPPIFLDARYRLPPTPTLLSQYRDGAPNWLFVGRLAPNKGQDALIAAFHAYKRLSPSARLFLVGAEEGSQTYRRWLENQIAFLGLQEDVHLAGQVSQAELHAYYRLASCFISLSEHEGFGVPLVESFYFDVPVIAYDAAAVPETLGGAGILLRERNPFLVAETAYLLEQDPSLREAVLTAQRQRLADFAYEKVAARLLAVVRWFGKPAHLVESGE